MKKYDVDDDDDNKDDNDLGNNNVNNNIQHYFNFSGPKAPNSVLIQPIPSLHHSQSSQRISKNYR